MIPKSGSGRPKFRVAQVVFTVCGMLLILWAISSYQTRQAEYATLPFQPYQKVAQDLKSGKVRELKYSPTTPPDSETYLYVCLQDGSVYRSSYPAVPEPLLQTANAHSVPITAQAPAPMTDPVQLIGACLSLGLRLFGSFLGPCLLAYWLLQHPIWLSSQSGPGPNRWIVRGKKHKGSKTASDSNAPVITFESMAGSEEAKQETRELIRYLQDPEPFKALGAKLPKGVLLSGPPGTGKTLMARAISGEANVPFLACSGSEFEEKYVGVGASRIRKLFQSAKELAPCLIFVDEIDSVGRRRRNLEGNVESQTLNQLLIEMDGFDNDHHVIVLAATNRPEDLDPALVRPGRFDRQVVLHAPDLAEREAILRVHAKSVKVDSSVDFTTLARMTVGFVGADLANLINESALCAVRSKRLSVAAEDFEQAFDRISMGLKRSSLKPSQPEQERTAYHESGHAIASLALPFGDPIHKLTILPRGSSLGLTHYVPERDRLHVDKRYFLQQLVVLCAGRAAEELIYGPEQISIGASAGSSSDLARATELAQKMVSQFGFSDEMGLCYYAAQRPIDPLPLSQHTLKSIEGAVRKRLDHAYQTAMNILKENKPLLQEMKALLIEKETLGQPDLSRLLQDWPIRPLQKNLERPL